MAKKGTMSHYSSPGEGGCNTYRGESLGLEVGGRDGREGDGGHDEGGRHHWLHIAAVAVERVDGGAADAAAGGGGRAAAGDDTWDDQRRGLDFGANAAGHRHEATLEGGEVPGSDQWLPSTND